MLEAGLGLFHHLPLADLWSGLTVSSVCRRARTARATFYTHWPTQQDYVEELVRAAADPARTAVAPAVAQAITELASRNTGIVSAVRQIARMDFEAVASSADFRMELALFAKCTDPTVSTALADLYRADDAEVAAGFELVLQRWGREPRPPFEFDDLATVFDAVMCGLVMRSWVDPERSDVALYQDVIVALLPQLTRLVGDERTVDDLAEAIEEFPRLSGRTARSRRAEGSKPGRRLPPTSLDPAEVIEVAIELLDHVSWPDLDVSRLAEELDTDEESVYGWFGSKSGIGWAVMLALTGDRLARQVREAEDAVEWFRAGLTLAGQFAADHKMLTHAGLQVITGNALRPERRAVPTHAVDELGERAVEAQAAGRLDPDLDAKDLAGLLLRNVLFRELADPAQLDLVELILRGACRPPPDRPSAAPTPAH